MRLLISFLMAMIILFEPSFLQAQQYPFVHYTPKDGLVSARARTMYQDSKGRLYISTFGGLSIFDGARFTNYTIENGLAANLINDVVEMGDDSIWILPNLNRIQCLVRGRLRDIVPADGFCPVINKVIKASDGSYYALADEGLFRLENNRFNQIKLKDETGKDLNKYLSTGNEVDNKILMITDPTIGSYPSPTYLIIHDLKTGKTCISKKPPEVYYALASPQKEILVCTSDGLKSIDKLALQRGEISFSPPPHPYEAAKDKVAHRIYFDREQNLWLAIAEGVFKINQQGFGKLYSVNNGLPVNRHYSMFQDKENIMWFTNEQTGITKLSNDQFEFYPEIKPGFSASDLYTDKWTDTVWFLDRLQKKLLILHSNGTKEYSVNIKSDWLFRVIPGLDKNYLTGYFELYQHDKDKKNTITPRLIKSYRDSMHGVPAVNFPMPDGYGNLLFSNDDINVALTNNKLVSYPLGYFGDQFVIGPDRLLWVTNRSNKLFLFRIHPNDPDHYFQLLKVDSILPNGPRSIALDTNGNLWIGTRDLGVFCFAVDKQFNLTRKHQLSTKTGLSDNCILFAHGDQEGNIWICSPVGLDKIQLKSGKWVVENITRGNNIYQNILKIATNKHGEHWILTSSGIIKILPSNQNLPRNFKAKILLTEIRAGRDTIDFSLNKPAFPYNKNDLFFQWAAPAFTDEKQTLFSYRLEGSKAREWSEPSTEAMIRFIDLNPGKYVFHIKASFPNGLYADTETSYAFEVLPPWWQTWWFSALVAIAIGLMTALLVKIYVRIKLEKQRHMLEKQQAIEKERTRIASDMHDDLGAGLSSIRFLSEKVKQNPSVDLAKNEISKIANISGELVENMNEIIWAMNEKNDTLEDLLFYTRSYAKEYCEENQLHCLTEFPEDIPTIFVSGEARRNIFLTIKESLHNIVKHSAATEVELKVSVEQQLTVMIKDNGQGFNLAHVEKPSSGNGLKNMKRRIESIGGEFNVLNGKGVTVFLKVPLH